jgi:hypothetical protein
MYKINNPTRADLLPDVVKLYAKKLNKEFLLEYTESNTKIHLIDSIRKAHYKDNLLLRLNHFFINNNDYYFKSTIDINIGKINKLDNKDEYSAENFANYINFNIEYQIATNDTLGIFLTNAFQISFEQVRYNYICLIANKENLDLINDYISKTSKKIQISQLQDFDETMIEPNLYDYENGNYSIEIDSCGIVPYKLKHEKFLVAYLITNIN